MEDYHTSNHFYLLSMLKLLIFIVAHPAEHNVCAQAQAQGG